MTSKALNNTLDLLNQFFPVFQQEHQHIIQQYFLDHAKLVEIDKDIILFHQGDSCENYYFLLEGAVKVITASSQGKEILLYRIKPGETCVLSTSCMINERFYPAVGITDTPCKALAVPVSYLIKLLQRSTVINQFFLHNFSLRVASLIDLICEVALERLDVRVARHLLQKMDSHLEIAITHDALALEIGTAREVISRQLGTFEKNGWITTQRGKIALIQIDTLEQLSQGYFR